MTKIAEAQKAVADFLTSKNIYSAARWQERGLLQAYGDQLLARAAHIEQLQYATEPDFARASKLLEELGEFLSAKSELQAFDALVDLLYVLLGAFEIFEFPAQEGFEEVHKSNMTKAARGSTGDLILRDKGSEYVAPDLLTILQQYRKRINGSETVSQS